MVVFTKQVVSEVTDVDFYGFRRSGNVKSFILNTMIRFRFTLDFYETRILTFLSK